MHKWKTTSAKIMGMALIPISGMSFVLAQSIDENYDYDRSKAIIEPADGMPQFEPSTTNPVESGLSLQALGDEPLDILKADQWNLGIGTLSPRGKLHITAGGGFSSEDENGVANVSNVPLVLQSSSTALGILNSNARQTFAINIDYDQSTTDARGIPTLYDRYDGTWHQGISLKNGNVGIGTYNPTKKLEVLGDVSLTGDLIYGASDSRTYYANDPGVLGKDGGKSGFYQTSAPSPAEHWYPGASSWQHLIDVRHSNPNNLYALQIAGSFWGDELYYRKTANDPARAWNRIVSEDPNGDVKVKGNIISDGDICFGNCQ